MEDNKEKKIFAAVMKRIIVRCLNCESSDSFMISRLKEFDTEQCEIYVITCGKCGSDWNMVPLFKVPVKIVSAS